MINPATPETTGAAMEVPECDPVPPPLSVVYIPDPGAETLMCGPVLDEDDL